MIYTTFFQATFKSSDIFYLEYAYPILTDLRRLASFTEGLSLHSDVKRPKPLRKFSSLKRPKNIQAYIVRLRGNKIHIKKLLEHRE